MFIALISLPPLIFLIAASFLFIDIKNAKAWMVVAPIFFLEIILLLLFVYLAVTFNADQKVLITKIQQQDMQIAQSLQSSSLLLARLSIDPEQTSHMIKKAALYGLTPNNTFFNRIKESDAFLSKITKDANRLMQGSTGLEVWQIPEDVNQKIVQHTLEQLGYKVYYIPGETQESIKADKEPVTIEDMTTEEPDGTLTLSLNFHEEPSFTTAPTENIPEGVKPLPLGNTLTIGQKASLNDAKIVALVLMRAGMNLKHIHRIRKTTRANQNAMIIEYNKLYEKRVSLTVERLASTNKLR